MSEHSIIEHRAKYHYAKVEEDYIAICSHGECSPHCKALILSILEGWMNKKFAGGEKNLYTYMTIPQWIDHTYRLYERNILIECLAELVKENLIKRNQITRYNQSTYEYILNTEVVQALIRALPEKETVYPRLDAYLAFREKGNEKRRERKKAKEEQLKNQLPPESATAVEKSTTPPLINNLPPLINQLNVSSYVSSPNVTSGECSSTQSLEQPDTDTPTFPEVDDYTIAPTIAQVETSTQPSMQLSTQANTIVDNSQRENHSQQSYSHRPATSTPTNVGRMGVLEVPITHGIDEVVPAPAVQVRPQAPASPVVKPAVPAPKLLHTEAAIAISVMYEAVAGPGGFAKWDWDAMEEMGKKRVTQEDIKLVFNHLKSKGKKRNVEQVWLNWFELATLKPKVTLTPSGEVHKSAQELFEEKNRMLAEKFMKKRSS